MNTKYLLCARLVRHLFQLTAIVLGTFLFMPHTSNAQVSLNHGWQPTTTFTYPQTSPYGLVDLDGFAVGSYGYCKWGNVIDTGGTPAPGYRVHLFNFLTTGPYTYQNPDLFLSRSQSSLQLIPLPFDSWTSPIPWSPFSPSVKGNIIWSPQSSDAGAVLFRKLHFSNALNDVTNTPVGSDTTKLIVVIHGWNPESSDPFTGAFAALKDSLYAETTGTGWKVVFYDWSADADTGEVIINPLTFLDPDTVNPTKAAEIAHLHGQHLGQLLAETANFQKIHFIAHSAGSWAARSATKYLLQNTGVKIQITLLDPFIPGEMKIARVTPNNTSLKKLVIDALPSLDPTNSGQLAYLDNYYALDDFNPVSVSQKNFTDYPDHATSQEFLWGDRGINKRIDSPNGSSYFYRTHTGPVEFYADTARYPNVPDLAPLQPFDVNYFGWRRSMFYQEPQIATIPLLSKVYAAGETAALNASVKIRGKLGVALGAATYQWEKKAPGGTWLAVASGGVAASNTPAYAVPGYTIPVTSGMNGTLYHLVVTNIAGTDISNEITLNVGTSGGTVIAAPSGLTASAVSPNQINLSWDNNAANATSVIIERKAGTGGTYSQIVTTPSVLPPTTRAYFDTGLAQGALYYYRIIATGSPNNSAPSVAASAATLPGTSTTRVLTINSSGSVSGVRILVGPNDINGIADGNTTFTRHYANSTNVTLIAPTTWTGSSFLKWRKDGEDAGVNAVTNVLMDTSHTMTAVYAAPSQGGTSHSIAVTAAPSNGGTVTGTGTYASNGTVSIQATAAPGYTFMKWTVNTSEANGGATFALQPQVSFQATANLSLVANFTFNVGSYWNVTTTSEPPAGGTASGAGAYAASSNVPLSAQPAGGYVFDYWTENGTIISYIQSYSYPQISQSHNFVAHFHIPAPGSAPDLFPMFILPQTTVFAGGSANRSVSILNQGTLNSSPFWFDFRISDSNTVMPGYGNLDFYAQRNFVGGQIPPGVQAGGSGSFTLPSNLAPGTYYMWMVVDPELASGEPPGNRSNNTTWQPLTVPPSPPASGPDLVPHDFAVTPAAVMVGGAINLNGAVRNTGNAASTTCKYYISISTSPSIAPDKNALNTFGNVPALGIYSDAGASSGLALPSTFTAGNYYLWIMTDPENTGGEPAGNRGNNNIVLPLTITQPPQTYTITASSALPAGGSVAGDGSYVEGALVPLVASPNAGYRLSNWTENGNIISTLANYSFIAGANRVLLANFALLTQQETWRQTWFGTTTNGGEAADTFDYDHDGLVNLAEYAFGLNPKLGSSNQIPQGQKSGSNFLISFAQPAGVTGISYGAEWSTTLTGTWLPITDTGTPPQHTFSVPIGSNTSVFVRLKVTSP